MRREWEFVSEVAREEMIELPARDRAKLAVLMEHYASCGAGNPSPAQIDSYGDGLYRIRHIKEEYQGRGVFFVAVREQGYEKLVLLTAYKKETPGIPTNILERARSRMNDYRRRG